MNSTVQAAIGTLDRVATVAPYRPSLTYPNNGFGQALQAVAGAMFRQIGTKVFWVATGGYDTHANQNPVNGAYRNLMTTVDGGLAAFHTDLRNQGLLDSTLVLLFSEFGRRITENGSQGTDHGAAGIMMAMGGLVRGGLYGTAAKLRQDPSNPDLENNAGDVRHETDFRSVYASVLDNWLGRQLGRHPRRRLQTGRAGDSLAARSRRRQEASQLREPVLHDDHVRRRRVVVG